MVIAIILVLAAALSLVFMLRVAKGRSVALRQMQNPAQQLRPVDIEAFRNLVDPSEAYFLWSNLSRAEFRKIQRERLRAAIEYISCASQNAAILIQMGELARLSPDPAVVQAGDKLVNSAIRLRIYAIQATAKLYVGMALPSARGTTVDLTENYERMAGLVSQLTRVQRAVSGAAAA